MWAWHVLDRSWSDGMRDLPRWNIQQRVCPDSLHNLRRRQNFRTWGEILPELLCWDVF